MFFTLTMFFAIFFLLQLALTHPSYVMNYGTNPDHARNTLSNCGVKQPRYGDRRNRLSHTKKKGTVQNRAVFRGGGGAVTPVWAPELGTEKISLYESTHLLQCIIPQLFFITPQNGN